MKNRALHALCVAFLWSTVACSSKAGDAKVNPAPAAPPRATGVREVPVQVFGALREMMHEGRLESRVHLQKVSTDDVFGVGALSELRGEVTIISGAAWLSYPEGLTSTRTVVSRAPTEGAALLVTSEVHEWEPITIDREISISALGEHIAAMASARGIDVDKPFPFLIEGPVRSLEWHVIDGSRLGNAKEDNGHQSHLDSAVRGRIDNASVLIVGFYSTHHQGVFTHHDSTVHLHVIDRANRHSGHVDQVLVASGATLKLPLR